MSQLSKFIYDRFATPREKDATSVVMRFAGDAGAEIIEYAQKTIALLDLTTIDAPNKAGIARALITAATVASGIKLDPAIIGWLVEEIVVHMRLNKSASAGSSAPTAVPPLPGH